MPNTTTPRYAAALEFISRGWSVIPVREDKKPFIGWREFQTRLPTEDDVNGWWSQWPEANVAIVTGSVSGLAVIDLDVGFDEGAVAALRMPHTLTVNTPSGGRHHYFRTPKGHAVKNCTDLLGNDSHVDVRGEGGYVVAPPSVSGGGGYRWVDSRTPIAEINPELLEVLTARRAKPTHDGSVPPSESLPTVFEGNRNQFATSEAGRLLARHIEAEWEAICWPALMAANESFQPPIGIDELRRSFDSVATAERSRRKEPRQTERCVMPHQPPISLRDLMNKEITTPKWAVEGLIETGSVTMISAPPNTGKSWLCLHLALCVANGELLFGRFPTEKGVVFFIDEDAPEVLTRDRLRKLAADPSCDGVFFSIQHGFRLTEALMVSIREEIRRLRVRYLIIDTLPSIFVGDENNHRDAQDAMNLLKSVASEGVTVIYTNHNRKTFRGLKSTGGSMGEEARGSSAFLGSVDGQLVIESLGKNGEFILGVHQTKIRGARKMSPFRVKILEEDDVISLTYDGEIEDKNSSLVIAKKIEETLRRGGWWSVKMFCSMRLGSEKTIRNILSEMTLAGTTVCKSRGKLEEESVTLDGSGNHNENFFRLSNEPDSGT